MLELVSRVGMEVPMAWIAPLGCRAGPVAPFGGLAGGAVVMMAAFWVGVWDGGMDESRAARIGSLLKLNQAFGEWHPPALFLPSALFPVTGRSAAADPPQGARGSRTVLAHPHRNPR